MTKPWVRGLRGCFCADSCGINGVEVCGDLLYVVHDVGVEVVNVPERCGLHGAWDSRVSVVPTDALS